MKSIIFLLVALLAFGTTESVEDDGFIPLYHRDAWLPTMEYYKYYGYPAQNFYVTTIDGYILQLFRIQSKNQSAIQETGLPVVFLQHGLLDNSDTFMINSEDKAPAFTLAQAGYDVWMGNNRGNMHSRNHTTLNPDTDKEAFWAFTFDDFASKDLVSMLSFVSNATGVAKFPYIGHSQGSLQMFAALADRIPEVVSRVSKFLAWGPVTYVDHIQFKRIPEPILKLSNLTHLVEFYNVVEFLGYGKAANLTIDWLKNHTIYDILPFTQLLRKLGIEFCGVDSLPCGELVGFITNDDYKLDNYERYDVLAGHDPAGTSFRNVVHWMQLMLSGKFQKFDFGHPLNKKNYGVNYPPLYDLSKIEEEVYMFVGNDDKLADLLDASHTRAELTGAKKVWWKQYAAGHCSFMWGKSMDHMGDALEILQGGSPAEE